MESSPADEEGQPGLAAAMREEEARNEANRLAKGPAGNNRSILLGRLRQWSRKSSHDNSALQAGVSGAVQSQLDYSLTSP
jgi:hypothetical protein